jgi:hypothetical protein
MFTPEEWKIKIEDWKKSGLTKKNWCNLNGIKFHSFKYWSARVKELDGKVESFNSSILEVFNRLSFQTPLVALQG